MDTAGRSRPPASRLQQGHDARAPALPRPSSIGQRYVFLDEPTSGLDRLRPAARARHHGGSLSLGHDRITRTRACSARSKTTCEIASALVKRGRVVHAAVARRRSRRALDVDIRVARIDECPFREG